mmetsp:Transcript_48622/g.99266  ORF Transcript_48622/g.99266 Transcript_48622/m.99266 type:complete len:267 (-) Transcript_48622:346-1146(-)
MHACPVLLPHVHAVRQHTPCPQQPRLVIDVDIVVDVVELAHELHLRLVLVHVRVHVHPFVLLQQLGGEVELLLGGGDSEAGGDGVEAPPSPVPLVDQPLACLVPLLGVLAQGCRRERLCVHHHLPCDHEHVAPLGRREQRFHRGFVDSAEGARRRRSAPQQLIQKPLRCLVGVLRVAVLLLCRKRVLFEPFQQLLPVRPDHVHLWEMNVRVDKPWNQHLWAVVLDKQVMLLEQLQDLLCISTAHHLPLLAHQQNTIWYVLVVLARV